MSRENNSRNTKQIHISIDIPILEKFKEYATYQDRALSNYVQFLMRRELEANGLIEKPKIEKLILDKD